MPQDELRNEFVHLKKQLENDAGSVDEAEQWLERLKDIAVEIDPGFYASDYVYNLEQMVLVRRKAEEISKHFAQPWDKHSLTELVHSIHKAESEASELDFRDLDARYYLLEQNILYPYISNLVAQIGKGMSAEEVVEIALSKKPIILP